MKAFHFFFSFLLIVIFTSSYAQDIWTQKADFGGGGRFEAAGFSINGKGYVGSGTDNNNVFKDFWEYDPVTDSWTQKANFAGGYVTGVIGFSIGNKGYFATGSSGNGRFWEYDPEVNEWTQKANEKGGLRRGGVGFSIGDKGYICTGSVNDVWSQDLWEYDPSYDEWTKKADFGGVGRSGASAFSLKGKGYVGTGRNDDDGTEYEDFWEYDPQTDSWAKKADFGGGPRSVAVGFAIGNKGYIATGNTSGSNEKDVWEYDPSTNEWVEKTSMPSSPRVEAVSFVIGNRAYVGTGYKNVVPNKLQDFWEYTPTIADCNIPSEMITSNVKSSSALLGWENITEAEAYSVRYRKMGANPWMIASTPIRTIKLTGLTAGTEYEWSVKSLCDAQTKLSSDWSATQNFTTKPLKLESENDDEEISIEVFPNPASTTITLSLPSNQNTILSIFNLLGEKVKEEKVTGKEVTLDVSSLPQGLYLVRMEDRVVGKFVKE